MSEIKRISRKELAANSRRRGSRRRGPGAGVKMTEYVATKPRRVVTKIIRVGDLVNKDGEQALVLDVKTHTVTVSAPSGIVDWYISEIDRIAGS